MFNGTITARVCTEPEGRATNNGHTIVSFKTATETGYGDKKKTTWVKVVVFGKSSEFVQRNLHKGDNFTASGVVSLDEWTNREGVKQSTLILEVDRIEKVWPPKGGDEAASPTRHAGPVATPDDGIPF